MAHIQVNMIQHGSNYWAELCRYAVAPDKTSAYAAWMHDFHAHHVWLSERPQNPDPRQLHYVSAVGFADPDEAPDVFRRTWDDMALVRRGNAVAHIVQSFDPADDLDAETAHAVARELTRVVFPGAQAVIGTHLDRPHLHNHIVVNNTLPANGRAISSLRKEETCLLHVVSNALCDCYGLVRDDAVDRERYHLWTHPNRAVLAKDLAYIRIQTDDVQETLDMLRSFGYEVKETAGGWQVKPKGAARHVSLPDLRSLETPAPRRRHVFQNLDGIQFRDKMAARTVFEKQLVQYLHLLGSQRTARREHISFTEYRKVYAIMDVLQYMAAHDLHSAEELSAHRQELKTELEHRRAVLHEKEKRRRELRLLFRAACVAAFPEYAQPADLREAEERLAAGPHVEEVREERRLLEAELLEEGRDLRCRQQELFRLGQMRYIVPQMRRTLAREASQRRERLAERQELSGQEDHAPVLPEPDLWDWSR